VLGWTAWAVAVVVPPAVGATINYGDFTGSTVTFSGVTESTPDLASYGAPTVAGDVLDFDPVRFDAASAGGGSETTGINLTASIVAHAGHAISRVDFSEAGDTTLAGIGPVGSLDTFSTVVAGGSFTIEEVDFAPVSPLTFSVGFAFSPSGGSFFLGTDGGGGPIFFASWSGGLTVDVEQALFILGVPFVGGATRVSFDFDDVLDAASEVGTSALIATSDLNLDVTTTPFAVPEPASAVALSVGLAALLLRRRLVR
jgi:hypothetical protein